MNDGHDWLCYFAFCRILKTKIERDKALVFSALSAMTVISGRKERTKCRKIVERDGMHGWIRKARLLHRELFTN